MPRLLCALLVCFAASFVTACGPSRLYTDADVPSISKLGDLMWAQAQASDPAFKLIGRAALTDEDYATATKAGERLKLTAPRIKMGFSKGAEYDAFADKLGAHADELTSAAAAKDSTKTLAALSDVKGTCKSCHKQFR